MKTTIFTFTFFICLFFNAAFSFGEGIKGMHPIPTCESISASFNSDKATAGVLETVTFTNTSAGNVTNKWYVNEILISTTEHFTHVFPISGDYNVKLEVFDENATCSAMITHVFTVNENLDFCGDLSLPDQNPAECDCMTQYDMDSTGNVVSETSYRWADRWGNKYCNLSIAGDCKDNVPFKSSIPVPNPPPPSCQAGYFNLYFIDQTINGTLYSIPQNQREIVCQVFADMAQLITPANPGVIVNFQIKATFDNTTSVLANAGSYYEINPLISNAILHGEVWKAINSGQNDPTLYDGVVNINLAKLFFVGYNNIAANPVPNQFDLYGLMQHELMHALGFASMITSYSGTSFYTANNLFSCLDEHLKDNGNDVISNASPGLNYSFNSLGNNCTSLRFNNQSLQLSPINSYKQVIGGGTTFNKPSHFDDVCSNNPSQLYVMNPGIAQNQQRRLQQEEVNALCKIGYVLTGNYGTSTLLINGSLNNPNQTSFLACSGTGTGIHLVANDDDYMTPFQYYITSCTVQNPAGSYQINVINNDVAPSGTTVVDIEVLGTGQILTATANGFTFSPATPGIWQISYRLLHASGLFSNYAIVTINVHDCSPFLCANNCDQLTDPNVCNLFCNPEMEKVGYNYFAPPYGISSLPSLLGPNGTQSASSPNYFEGWQTFCGSPDWLLASAPYTTFNSGYAMTIVPTSVSFFGKESFGQCVQLNPGVNYILSTYHRRKWQLTPSDNSYQFFVNTLNTNNLPLGSFTQGAVTDVPVPSSQTIYSSPIISATTSLDWRQHVVSFTPPQFQNFIYIHALLSSTNGFNIAHFDNIELIEDNFTAGVDQNILCGQSAQLSAPCMELTNLHYEWYELDASGNPITPALTLDANVTVTPTSTTTYRLRRFIANQGNAINNGYFVENAASLFAEDDITVFVTLPSGGADFTNTIDCGTVAFVAQNQTGTHFWDFGDGNTSTQLNPLHNYLIPGTYTVTHTVTEFGCTASFSQTITTNLVTTNPTFTPIAPICSGDNLVALPTSSTNIPAITGTWSAPLNNTTTTTYTFTPTSGQCATATTMTIVVEPNILPTFNPIAPICSGANLAALPTSSTNTPAITGTWSPPLNNTTTTTYTFTPTPGQCATTATMTIVVNPIVLPTFTPIAPICLGDNLAALPTSSTNTPAISGIWSPPLDNTTTTIYTFTPTLGQCATTTMMTIAINPNILPTFTPIAPICSGANLAALPTSSTNTLAITGTWSPPINNTTTTTYTFTPTPGQCATTTTMTIAINPNLLPTFTPIAPICSGDNLAPLPISSTNTPAITGTWSPPLNNTTTTIYTFTPAQGQCATTTTMTIVVEPNILPTFNPIAPICSGANLAALATSSTNTPAITGTWSPPLNNTSTTTYTFSPTPGQCATTATMTIVVNPIVLPTFTPISPICSGANLAALPTTSNNGITGTWSPALDNTTTTIYTFTPNAGECATTTTMTITVNPIISPTFTQVGPYCPGASIPSLPNTSNNGIGGTWSPAIDAYASATYTFTPNAGECAATATMNIIINPAFVPTFNLQSSYCIPGAPVLPPTSSNGIPGSWSPPVISLANTIYTFTPATTALCETPYSTIIQSYAVQPAPQFAPIAPICVGTNYPLPTVSINGITGTWSPAFSSALPGTTTYTFTPDYLNNPICTPTAQVQVIVEDCGGCNTAIGTQISGTIGSLTSPTVLPPGNYRVVGDLNIDGMVTITNCVFAIEPNKKITVNGSDDLMIYGSHLYGCQALWDGIEVDMFGKLTLAESGPNNNTLIEDAKIAVDVKPYTSSINTNRIRIAKTIFNKNNIGIRINNYPWNNPNVVFSLSGNVFTKRTLWSANPAVWPATTALIAPNPLANGQNSVNPRINPLTYPDVNILPTKNAAGVLNPAPLNAAIGMDLKNVGQNGFAGLSVGLTTDVNPYVFDRMFVGIDAYSSVVDVRHAYFQAPVGTSNLSVGIRTNTSVPNTTFNGRLLVEATATSPVQFYNLKRAIDVLEYTQITVQDVSIRTNKVALTPVNTIGELGIRYQSRISNNVTITKNEIHNVNIGIFSLLGSPSNTVINLNISNNTIRKNINGLGGAIGQIISQGISVERNPITTGSFTGTLFSISDNKINEVRRGITIQNITARGILINGNLIDIRESTALNTSTGARYWGIYLNNVNSTPTSTTIPGIQSNVIDGATYQSNLQVRGIMLLNSTNFRISCNDLNQTGAGLYFNGNGSFNTIRQNTLRNHRFGLWLESATIGAQGANNSPSENVWASTWNSYGGFATISNSPIRIKTFVSGNTLATNSPMQVRVTASHNPNNSWAKELSGNIPFSTSSNSLFITGGNLPQACLMNGIYPPQDSLEVVMIEASNQTAMEQSTSTLDSLALLEASEVIREMTLYDNLDRKPELLDNSNILEDFYDERSDENIGLLREMDKQIEEQDLLEASYLRDQVLPENVVELGYKSVYSLILEGEKGTFTPTDSTALWNWAVSCGYLYGKASSLAQSAYNSLYRESIIFEEDCPAGMQRGSGIINENERLLEIPKLVLTLYPNPTKEYLYVLSNDINITNANCIVRNLDGREIYSGEVDFEKGINLNSLNLVSGLYRIELTVMQTKEVIHQQFIFFK